MVAVMSAQEIIKQIKSLPINYLIKRIGQTLMPGGVPCKRRPRSFRKAQSA